MSVMFLNYISDEMIKTTTDQVTTQSNFPVSNFVLLNSVNTDILVKESSMHIIVMQCL